MTKKSCDVLKRADRALLGAFALAVSVSALVVLVHNVPSTEQVALGTRQMAQGTIQLADKTQSLAATTGRVAEASALHTAAALRGTIAEDSVVRPFRAVASLPAATEATIIRVLQDQRCLAEAMYYEARGEGREGQEAIAEVVFHRMHTAGYPHTICGVVYQGVSTGHGCQFSFACNGELEQPKSAGAWTRARTLAARIMAGAVHLEDMTEDAISFHAADVQPDWADHLERTIQIGNHVFYRAAQRSKDS